MFHIYGLETKQFDCKKGWRREKDTQRNGKAEKERKEHPRDPAPWLLPSRPSDPTALVGSPSMDQVVQIPGPEGQKVPK